MNANESKREQSRIIRRQFRGASQPAAIFRGALEIIRSVLVASASILGVFSPVLIDVEAEGRRFAEMHVDGGVTRNLFVAPDPVLAAGSFLPPRTSGRIFIIVDNKVPPDFQVVENSLLPIVERSVLTLVKANTSSVLLASYQFARTNRLEFNLAAIDPAYPTSTTDNFDREYMLGLFQHGIERAHSNQMWQKTVVPPPSNPNSRPQGSSRNNRVGFGGTAVAVNFPGCVGAVHSNQAIGEVRLNIRLTPAPSLRQSSATDYQNQLSRVSGAVDATSPE